MFIAPLVGMMSDNHRSRWGRRRPFLFFGLISILLFSTIFSNSKHIAEFLGGPRWLGQAIGIVSFALNDFSIGVVQFPQRTLSADLVPAQDQTKAQAMQAVMQVGSSS